MPGIAGFTFHRKSIDSSSAERALDIMAHERWYRRDPVFCDGVVVAGRTHLGVIGEQSSPFESGGIHCWVEGEAYNTGEACSAAGLDIAGASFPSAVVDAYRCNMLPALLKHIDGYFAAAVYDAGKGRIILISDRYGLKPLYVARQNGLFAWSSEIKGFFACPAFEKKVVKDALECFLGLGHFTGDMTWFEGVTMMSPSSMLVYDIASGTIAETVRYWKWSDIKRSPMSFDEAVEALAPILKRSVARRVAPGERVGLALTGGLDSRAMLGSLADPGSVIAYTFGREGSWDVVIARQAAAVRGVKHRVYVLDGETWFEGRLRDVWRTDGMQNILHMHAARHLPAFKEFFDINLNGYWGDIIGGFYFQFLNNRYIQTRINRDIARELYGRYADFDDASDAFYDIESIDPYVFNNRGRRFAASGSISHSAFVEQRKPFVDNEVIEYIYMIPDRYRINGRLYNAALLKAFPELYRSIPWQGSGFPISRHTGGLSLKLHKLMNIHVRLSLPSGRQDYTDYQSWLKHPAIMRFMSETLDPKKAVYPDYIGFGAVEDIMAPYRDGKPFSAENVCRAATMETWLRRVFKDQSRDVPQP